MQTATVTSCVVFGFVETWTWDEASNRSSAARGPGWAASLGHVRIRFKPTEQGTAGCRAAELKSRVKKSVSLTALEEHIL